jgi:hypothetical protein
LNQENKITNEQRIAKSKAEKKARFAQDAKSADKYYGRRYLGTTKYGKDIWITNSCLSNNLSFYRFHF